MLALIFIIIRIVAVKAAVAWLVHAAVRAIIIVDRVWRNVSVCWEQPDLAAFCYILVGRSVHTTVVEGNVWLLRAESGCHWRASASTRSPAHIALPHRVVIEASVGGRREIPVRVEATVVFDSASRAILVRCDNSGRGRRRVHRNLLGCARVRWRSDAE